MPSQVALLSLIQYSFILDSVPIRVFRESGIMQDLWPYFWVHTECHLPGSCPNSTV